MSETTLKPYPDYNNGTPDWLGQIPNHWRLEPAWSVMRERKVKNEGLAEQNILSLSYGRIIRRDMSGLKGLLPDSFEGYQILEPGNVVMRTTDMQNDRTSLRFGYVRERGIITSAYMALEAKGYLLPEYMYRYLHALDTKKVFYGMGSGLRQSVDFPDLKRLPLPVPPPREQEAIVRYLNWFDGNVNRLIRAKQRLIALLNEQKQAIIQRAVTRGLDPDVSLKPSGVEWLGDVPAHWKLRRAKNICERIVDCKNRTPEIHPLGEYIVVRTSNVRNGKLDLSDPTRTNKSNYIEWTQRGAPRAGDVFFTREAPAGQACVVPDGNDLCMGQRMMYLRPMKGVMLPEFLLANILGPLVQRYIEIETNGSTVGHLRLGQVGAMPILWAPLDEQEEIIAHIKRETSQLESAIETTTREIALIREYRTRLIADVVTGKLDVRGVEVQEGEEEIETNAMMEELSDELLDADPVA